MRSRPDYPPLVSQEVPHGAVADIGSEEEMITSLQKQMEEAEHLVENLYNLLTNYETTLKDEGIHEQVEALTRWAEYYRHSLLAADRVSQDENTEKTRGAAQDDLLYELKK